jgi:hypothetical protein
MSGTLTAIAIIFIVSSGLTAAVVTYFQLQGRQAEAVAMAGYRRLAEQAVANQEQLVERLTTIEGRLGAVEQILRDVG